MLVPQEVDELFGNLRELKAEGLTVLFISHKLDEVLARRRRDHRHPRAAHGRAPSSPAEVDRPPAGRADGRQRAAHARDPRVDGHRRRRCSSVERPDRRDRRTGRRDRSTTSRFTIHKGEVLGIAGVEGNGQAELVEAIMGMRAADAGTDPARRRATSPRWPPGSGARPASATSPRTGTGRACCWRRRCGRTASSATRPSGPTSRGVLIDRGGARARHRADRRASTTSAPRASTSPPSSLSGGNQQKLIVGREMSRRPEGADRRPPDPRRRRRRAGRDLGPHPRRPARDGLAVLLISADLDELIGLSDTLRVI